MSTRKSLDQIQELLNKECIKRDKKYRSLEQKYNKLQESLENSQQQKNMSLRDPRGASNKKKSQPSNIRRVTTQRCRSTSRRRPRPPTGPNGTPTVPTTTPQATIWKSKKGTGAHDRNRRKCLRAPI